MKKRKIKVKTTKLTPNEKRVMGIVLAKARLAKSRKH